MSGRPVRHNKRRNTQFPEEALVSSRLLTKAYKLVGWVVGWVLVGVLFEFVRIKIFPTLG
jgi:hypothetical protein